MRMISMSGGNEFTTAPVPVKQNKEINKETVEKASFKSQYDNNVEKKDVKETEKNPEATRDNALQNKKEIQDDTKPQKVTPLKSEKITPQSVKPEQVVFKKDVNLNNSEKTDKTDNKKNIKSKKTLTKSLKKADSEKEIKGVDEDSLNQSIAASQTIDTNKDELTPVDNSGERQNLEVSDEGIAKIETNNESQQQNINVLSKNSTVKQDSLKDKEKSSKDKKESKIKVNDLRSDNKANNNIIAEKNAVKTEKAEAANQIFSETINAAEGELIDSGADNTIVLGSTELSAEGEGGKAQAPVMKEAASLLKQQLKDFGNNDIVKQSRFILKDNNVGEIKLILRPESLGQVKINLNLNENSLAGQIVVENNSVKEIFQENMANLSKALEEQGFDSAKLDVTLNDKEGQSSKKEQKQNKQYFSDRLKRIDESGQVVRYGAPAAGINLTA